MVALVTKGIVEFNGASVTDNGVVRVFTRAVDVVVSEVIEIFG